MSRKFYFILSVFVFYIFLPATAQDLKSDISIYGLDPIVYNGKVYNYFPGVGVKGHQYFEQKDFNEGCISIRGAKYENVLINYDILNQDVILKYSDPQGSNRLISVSKAWLKQFSVSNEQFSILDTPEGEKLIVQTLNQGSIQLHIHWTKKLIAVITFIEENYVFDKKNSILFLSYKDNLQEFKSTKDILALLDKDAQQKVKKYLKVNKIKARTNSQDQLIKLLNYCNQLDL